MRKGKKRRAAKASPAMRIRVRKPIDFAFKTEEERAECLITLLAVLGDGNFEYKNTVDDAGYPETPDSEGSQCG